MLFRKKTDMQISVFKDKKLVMPRDLDKDGVGFAIDWYGRLHLLLKGGKIVGIPKQGYEVRISMGKGWTW